MHEVVRIEVLKLLQAGIIYPISESTWVSPTQVVPKKSGVTTVKNEKGEDVSTRLTHWLEGMHRLQEAQCSNKKRSLPYCPSLISFLLEFLGTHSIAFWIGIQGTFR